MTKFKHFFVTLFDIRGDYDQNMNSVKKIPLLDFSIQRLWGENLKIRRSFSVLNFLSK